MSTEQKTAEQKTAEPRPVAVYTDMEDLDFTAGRALLEAAGYEVRYLATRDPEAIVAGAAGAEALLVGYAPVTAAMLDRLPGLRIVALVSMGFDNVDIEAARACGVWVTNLPGVATEEVATHALAMMLSALRELPFFEKRVAEGDWLSRPRHAVPRLSEQRLGLVGLGRIGRRLAGLARPLFGEIVAYDPYLPDTAEQREELAREGIRLTDLDEVLATTAAVSLHVPLTETTHHLIGAEQLGRMRAGSVLVNVSRGQLIDGAALRDAVDSGHLRAAALDVLDVEPAPAGHPLVGRPRIQVTPHVAFLSERTLAEYVRIQAQNVVTLRDAGRPDTPLFDLTMGTTRA